MARKTRRTLGGPPAPNSGGVRAGRPLGYLLTTLVAFALGAGAMYIALRPALTRSAPQNTDARQSVAQASLQAGNAAYDARQWPQAIQSYTLALASGLDNPDIRTDLGNAYRFSGQPDQALAQYQAAQKENPRHENSLFNQGGALIDKGDFPRAHAAWQAYLQRFPNGSHAADAQRLLAAPVPAPSAKHP